MMVFKNQMLSNWSWRDSSDPELSGKTAIPTNIHLDLIDAKLIEDPFMGENEANVQWVHSRTWIYTTEFEAEAADIDEAIDLVFEGLDTFATVALNGHEILKSDNMFLSHRIDVREWISSKNKLEITFESAYDKSEQLRAEHGHRICWNGHYGRVFVRKAQYHFGWDWGPSLVTCGPWKPVRLERYTARVEAIKVATTISDDLSRVDLVVEASVMGEIASTQVILELSGPDGAILETRTTSDRASVKFTVKKPSLWYPHTHGEQPLYHIKAILRSESNQELDSRSQTLGIRNIELVQSPLKEGSTFYFKCNGVPIFIGGSNWIPGDNFLPRMTPEKYARWIDLSVRGNQNMLRVWGGGIYEDEAFYDACDRRGILVWQDFGFACGQYPSDPDFVEGVKREATQAIQRLRSHPSLVIWAGNNEDYQVANEGLKHDMQMPKDRWADSSFGARVTYEEVLPDLVSEHAPGSIYWPGSPWGGIDNNSDKTIGDVHIWNVSSGMLLPYQRYPDAAARFISEFGMLSCPSIHTVNEAFFGDSKDRHPMGKAFEFHIKATSHEKRMFTCMGENFRLDLSLEKYIYLSQLTQSEAMYYAFRGWRRLFEGRECGGALVWQTNDSWPVVSWAIADYYERPKMAYYSIARAMKPLATGISRKMKVNPRPNLQHEAFISGKTKADAASVIAHATPHIYPKPESTYVVWIANSGVETKALSAAIRFISIATGKEIQPTINKKVESKATGTTEVSSGATPEEEPTVVVSEIFDSNGELLSHDIDWPQPLKHITFPNRDLSVRRDGERLTIETGKPIKGLFFTNDKVQWSDNGFDVAPGQKLVITGTGLIEEPEWIYYGIDD